MRRSALLGTLAIGGCFLFQDPTENGGPSSSGPAVDDDTIPAIPYCEHVLSWPMESVEFEEDVLVLVNEQRAAGGMCGSRAFGPSVELTMNGGLRCAARVHSADMAARQFFDHVNPDGETPYDRFGHVGFDYTLAGENIAAGQPTPEEVVAGWMASQGHCENILESGFTHIGVGLHVEADDMYGRYWTQTFGTPL
jgi:uncharacterized protein YkwD